MGSVLNNWADFWFYEIGANVIPADTMNKIPTVEWSQYQNNPIPADVFEQWKKNGAFDKGVAIIPGKLWRGPNKDKNLVFIDLDNQKAIDEVCSCFGAKDLEELSHHIIVEQHKGNLSKAHLYFYSNHEFRKKSSDVIKLGDKIRNNEVPAIELKGLGEHGIAFCSPSMHKDGTKYEIRGTKEPKTCGKEVEDLLLEIYKKYNLEAYNGSQKIPIEKLFERDFVILEGHNRPEGLLRTMESLIARTKKILSEEQIKKLAIEWNREHCRPPLDDKKFEEQWKDAKKFIENSNNDNSLKKEGKLDDEPKKTCQDLLMEIAVENTKTLFRDQYGEGFAYAFVKDHCEVMPLSGSKFKRFLSNMYYETHGKIVNPETVNNVVNVMQAKAEFGDVQYDLNLRVTWHDGDLYYDLTNERHQCIRISKNGSWQILDQTPVPLFRRYNQIPQDLPSEEPLSENEDPLETFVSRCTNIKDDETKMVVKVMLVSWFIPNIPHPMLIVHGGKGSAKSMFQTLAKNIVDPAKPSLLTIHNDKSEYIQQVAHNYLAAYDNLKYNPKWLSDEACKTITGIGQTKRALYTIDEDKIFEYKHCLMFNGINVAFSESDVIDRSILIELTGIREESRRTEDEIMEEFYKLKPKILKQIFDILAKAITMKNGIILKRKPRMADFVIWGEAISMAMGYKEKEFLDAYYNNIKLQNAEVIDSNPVAFAIKKFVEYVLSTNDGVSMSNSNSNVLIYEGTPAELLDELNKTGANNKIGIFSREWPKDQRWLVRRINLIKSNLQQELGIVIYIERDSKNTSTIKIEKNVSAVSCEHKMSPGNGSLTPYFEYMSPANSSLSPEEKSDLSTKSNISGDTGDTGDISDTLRVEGDKPIVVKETESSDTGQMVGFREPFYYCKQHPHVQNIHRDEIKHHIQFSKEHAGE